MESNKSFNRFSHDVMKTQRRLQSKHTFTGSKDCERTLDTFETETVVLQANCKDYNL